jgi:hypothetical protein
MRKNVGGLCAIILEGAKFPNHITVANKGYIIIIEQSKNSSGSI